MKKILLFAAMALAMVGCTEDYKDWLVQNPNTTPDPEVTISSNMADVPAIDYANVNEDGDVQLFVPTYQSSPELDSVVYTAVIYNADKSENKELVANSEGKVSAAAFKDIVRGFYGKLPEQNMVPALFIARLYSGKIVAKEIHEAVLDVTIPYHGKPELKALAVPGGHQGWDPTNYGQALYEINPENNPNVYSGYVYMDAGTEFKFADGSWDVNWGSEDGKTLVPGGSNITASADGCYYITVDLNALTFSMEVRNWSLVGDGVGGWDNDVDLVYSKDDGVYYATYDFNGSGEFKFRANHGWDVNLGIDKDGEPGDLIQDGKNIPVPGAGKFSVTLTFEGGYPVYEIIEGSDISKFKPYVYFIGATDGWANAEQKLALVGVGIYTGYVYCADPNAWGNEFKFQRVAGSWDNEINSGTFTGGISGDFADGGGNIKATGGEGVYYVEMNLPAGTLKGTRIINMNLVGDFNGWNPADDTQLMTWNATDFCFEITGAGVTAAGWKFTTNNSWDINLGGTIDNLEANGANLGVVGSTIKLYPTRKNSDKIYCTVE